jgi:hypothetical protein
MTAKCVPILLSALLASDLAIASGPTVAPAPAIGAPVQTYAQTTYAPTLAAAPCEPRFCFNAQEPWIHGYTQEVPLYGGFHAFRPYNYKHALAQSQIAAGWGMSATSPYSQQYWHRNHAAASMTGEGAALEAPPLAAPPLAAPPLAAQPLAAQPLAAPLEPSSIVPAAAWQTHIYPAR